MEKNRYIERMTAVINTLNATMLRADQIDAIQRISACTNELKGMIVDMTAEEQTGGERSDDRNKQGENVQR